MQEKKIEFCSISIVCLNRYDWKIALVSIKLL